MTTPVKEKPAGTLSIGGQVWGLLRTMRPKQWLKNGFIFVPLLFDGKLLELTFLSKTLAGFGLLCLISSTVYLVNDLVDIEADRAHPKKSKRPLAARQLSKGVAIAAAVLFPLAAIPVAYLLDPSFAAILASYLALQILYSFYLKKIVLIDVLTIAAGFLLRVSAGAVLVEVNRFSPWLYVFTTMLALFLGFTKRRQELVLLKENANSHRKILDHYNLTLLDQIIIIVTSTTLVTYALYTFSAEGLPINHAMMLTTPFVLYGVLRYLYLIHVKDEVGPPDEVILKDHPLQLAVGLWGIAVFIVLYVLA